MSSEKKNTNKMVVEFSSVLYNVSFARVAVSTFIIGSNPTFEEISDVSIAVSEAVTNSIIHGYENRDGKVRIQAKVTGMEVYLEIIDYGQGILDVKKAMEPMFTTKPGEERSGMGFSLMKAFMDRIEVESTYGQGTVVKMWKKIGSDSCSFVLEG